MINTQSHIGGAEMHTEDEAKKKWCPMARCGGNVGCNRGGGDFASGPYCIGSDCMMWRWLNQKVWQCAETGEIMHKDFSDNGKLVSVGYCGITGKPEVQS